MGTLIKPTTLAKKMPGSGGAGTNLSFAKYRNAGNTAWVDCGFIKRRNGGNTAWIWEYSTPDVTAGVSGTGAGSGSSASGTSTRSLSASPGGVNSGTLTYSWGRQSGDVGTYLDSSTAQNPTVKRDFSGVANGTTDTTTSTSSVWRCTVTDTVTGAQVYSDVTVGAFSWQNQIPAFTPFSDTFTTGGAGGNVTIPLNSSAVTITVVGGGGAGGFGHSGADPGGGGGGGSGGISVISGLAISSGNWNLTLGYSVAAVGGTSASTGSVAGGSATTSATGGSSGGPGAGGGGNGGGGGSPGGFTGGSGGTSLGGSGAGAGFSGPGNGGNGGSSSGFGQTGGNAGMVKFDWV